jgi:hypothetical protein
MRSGEEGFPVYGGMADDASGIGDFAGYAAARGLAVEDGVHLPRTTPLLAAGELRSVEAVLSGWLSKYVEAKLALVTRAETTTDAAGAETRGAAHFTVAVTHVPKAKQFVPWMTCHRIEDEHLLGHAFAQLVGGAERVAFESAELDAHYRLHAAPERDDVWLHELFSPSFIVFLIEQAPKGFAFEYVEGTLCVSVIGRRTLTADLDGLRDATVELVGKIRAEIREALGRAEGRSDPEVPGYSPPSSA